MSRRKSFTPPGAEQEARNRTGEQLADELGISVTHVRLATYHFHNGERWTIKSAWEKLLGGHWVEVDAFEVPTGRHSTPKNYYGDSG